MKTNKMMRLASILLVAVMISTCAISGTFAKYVTSDSAKDEARVAKFGVVVTASGSLFSENYFDVGHGNGPTDGDANISVKSQGAVLFGSSNVKNVVAPGSKNEEGLKFTIAGTPEVAVKVEFKLLSKTDIFLAQKEGLPDMTTGNADDKFDNDVSGGYYPVKFTLKNTGGDLVTGNLSAIEAKLTELSVDKEAETILDETYTLTWEWDFDDSGAGTYDKQDTLLGDLAAGTDLKPNIALTAGTDYNLNIDFEIEVTVTQID